MKTIKKLAPVALGLISVATTLLVLREPVKREPATVLVINHLHVSTGGK